MDETISRQFDACKAKNCRIDSAKQLKEMKNNRVNAPNPKQHADLYRKLMNGLIYGRWLKN